MLAGSSDDNPYVGPRPFSQDESHRFFGREREARDIASLIIANRSLLIYSQSGVGKTSLINAKVIPLLEAKRCKVLPLARLQGHLPNTIEPGEIANRYVFNTLANDRFMQWVGETDPHALIQTSLATFLQRRPRPVSPDGRPYLRVLIFDQFEEIFGLHEERWPDRKGFFQQVREALEDDTLLRIILIMREDFLAQLDPYVAILPDKLRSSFRLERLRQEAALAAVTGPLDSTSCTFAPGVAEKLVEKLLEIQVRDEKGQIVKVSGEFIEPVQLQSVCYDLWRNLRPGTTLITEEHIENLNVDRVLETFFGQAVRAASERAEIHENRLRQWCRSNLITATETRNLVHGDSVRINGVSPATMAAALAEMEAHHVIRSEWRAGAHWYELTHDRLIKPIIESIEMWNNTLIHHFQEADTLIRKARHLLGRKGPTPEDYRKALEHAENAYRISLDIDDAWGMIQALDLSGDIHRAGKRDDEALAAYDEALRIAAQNDDELEQANQLIIISEFFRSQKRNEEALAAYVEAVSLTDRLGNAELTISLYLEIGNIYHELEDYDGAVDSFTDLLQLESNSITDEERAAAFGGRAAAYWYAERYEEAVADYTKAIELDDGRSSYCHGRGSVLAEMAHYEAAVEDLEKATESWWENSDPIGLAYAHNGLGLAYAGMRQYKRAAQSFERSIAGSPQNAFVYYNRALMHEWMGNPRKAMADYQRSLTMQDPTLSPRKRTRAASRLAALGQGKATFTPGTVME